MSERTIISVEGPASPAATVPFARGGGLFLDGDHAAPQPVQLTYDDGLSALVFQTGDVVQTWPYDAIRQVRDQAGGDQTVLRLMSDPTARLILRDAVDRQLIRSRAKTLAGYVSHVRR
jgi:hypothetical protein